MNIRIILFLISIIILSLTTPSLSSAFKEGLDQPQVQVQPVQPQPVQPQPVQPQPVQPQPVQPQPQPQPQPVQPQPQPAPSPVIKNEIICGDTKWVRATKAIPFPNTNVWLLQNTKTNKIIGYANTPPNAFPSCGPKQTHNALTENKITVLNALEAYLMTSQASGAYNQAQKDTITRLLKKTMNILANNQAIQL